jgi:NADH-quinone oxidoreductase subunit G
MVAEKNVMVDGRRLSIAGEKNLLELIRRADIEIPTFCYHSELSVYGACRLCLVDVEGMGVVASCSTAPQPGMIVRTQTAEIREMRKITIELLLANHHQGCTTCVKSDTCKLLDLARRLGVDRVRFKSTTSELRLDDGNPSLVRDPAKCVLCGDCVRFCAEVQGIGAIDFAGRGACTRVTPAFNKGLDKVECVFCGQCAAVCPTGAITPKSQIGAVWEKLHDPGKKVVVQVAPAVRVALGEAFGLTSGGSETGRLVAALKALGFDQVYDSCFAADLTVIEEATELLGRVTAGGNLPQFTSCCPSWVKFAEQYFPELLPRLSTCRSPQQMFGALAKRMLPDALGIDRADLCVVSIMPCTAKKFEAQRPEFNAGDADVDHVLTTQELARMIKEAGLRFADLEPAPFDLPLGFKTGAGVLFGNSGGVSEAALRFLVERLDGKRLEHLEFHDVRGEKALRVAEVNAGGRTLRVAVVYGLQKAREVAERVLKGECDYHFVEVMACPGGCIGGAGQPVTADADARRARTRGIYREDSLLQLHKSQENPYVREAYDNVIGAVGGPLAHNLLHTHYCSRKRIVGSEMALTDTTPALGIPLVQVNVCVGTSCFLRGSQKVLQGLLGHLQAAGLADRVAVAGSFCHERCNRGPVVVVNSTILERCDLATAKAAVTAALDESAASFAAGREHSRHDVHIKD